jgi:hypothetical protein
MRFVAIAAALAVFGSASAAVIEQRQTGAILNCICLHDRLGNVGTKVVQDATTYTCSYPTGSCQWAQVRIPSIYR